MDITVTEHKPIVQDTIPAIITDHAFIPRGEWWSLCARCGLAAPAHSEVAPEGRAPFGYYSDDDPDED